MSQPSAKALIPAAGLGTRFYPFSKAVPKELVPLLNVPVIDYVLDEIFEAGIKDVVSVVSVTKKLFEDQVERVVSSKGGCAMFARQYEQKGLGHAVWCARRCYADEFVPVLLPDNIFVDGPLPLVDMWRMATELGISLVAVQEVSSDEISKYGVVDVGDELAPGILRIKKLVEKPHKDRAPSNLAIVGRYVFSSQIFDCLEKTSRGAIGEYQLTDAIQGLVDFGSPVYTYKVQAKFLDVGTPAGWLKAVLAMASRNPDLMEIVRAASRQTKSESGR